LFKFVDFEDLALLDTRDLRMVLREVPVTQVLEALVGTPAGFRQSLLTKLSPPEAARLETEVAQHGPVTFEAVRTAQRTLVDALCCLSRGGQVAFSNPEDMVA
jgi:flagellar motor switch protein FliG